MCGYVSSVSSRYVPTGIAARELGVGRQTLARWKSEHLVTPALVTPGGHARWDVEDLKRQLHERRLATEE
jgi:hypothetical protein